MHHGAHSADGSTLAIHGTRIAALEKQINDLSATIQGAVTSINAKFDERSKAPWSLIIAGISVLFTVLVYFSNANISPLANDVKRLETAHTKLMDEVVPYRFHTIKWASVEDQIKSVEKVMESNRLDLQRQTTANTERLNGLSSPRDFVAEASQRIMELERQLSVTRSEMAKILGALPVPRAP